MHNLNANFRKMLNICNIFGKKFTNDKGNIPRRGVVPKFSDLEVIALNLTAEALSIDSENLLFNKLKSDYKDDFPNLISRRQYNDRRKLLFDLTYKFANVQRKILMYLKTHCIDSNPVERCRPAGANHNKLEGPTTKERLLQGIVYRRTGIISAINCTFFVE